jgi:DNA methylase
VAETVARYGTGALNIDASRVGDELRVNVPAGNKPGGASLDMSVYGMPQDAAPTVAIGRWPPNVLFAHLDECDEEACGNGCPVLELDLQNNGASRFFPAFRYEKKASRSERDAGLEAFAKVQSQKWREGSGIAKARLETARPMANTHPTVKPVALMRWLVRLVTPPDGFVLDPFMGSGTTGVAAVQEGFRFVGVEREAEYFAIAEARIEGAARG